ncbi:MAG: undecaprenyl/decaprenyl-phosphate alpha-N-acetylglucosaminyl 1-phosphate transferase [Anaerolineae bacterium]|nr:undecaprenyl/decaprenyl-phosphate alpha-N-acetylglucosaminyl 1-phosphate transferase [Anaerolineae bacterium]NIN95045.1 undecaprenyl/decaprenyl-phosphate alpha-N-acetylglucosaminyl 1-phosphate transferase [Anaerolineae bacterium]NIQ78084.1 undecaprenyl/decaprenyl-phosphate alpha-N-acetylglucosaminyl 1-phosphate transferase [Anaerolineae bacterium]
MIAFLLTFAVAFLGALILTPIVGRLALRFGFVDVPHEPKHVHQVPVPRLGGVALFFPFLAAVGLSLLLPVERQDPLELARWAGLILGSALVFGLGLYDDKRELRPLPQFVVQFLAAGVAIYSGIIITEIANPFDGMILLSTPIAVAFTLFWLMGMMNTVNWLDGLDGLAGGVTVIASVLLFAHSYRLGQYSIALLPLALAGCVLGFLPFNFYPAKIFMGTSGALFLGFGLGSLAIIGGAKMATALLVLGIPILDVAWQIINRLRLGRSPFLGDRGHLHHRLLDLGFSQRRVVLVFYALCAAFGTLALILPSGFYKLLVLVGMGMVALVVLVVLARRG